MGKNVKSDGTEEIVIVNTENINESTLQDAEEKYEEAKQHMDLDAALHLLIEAYNILESYYERIRNISTKTGSEAVSDKEYADFSRLYRAVYGSLQGIAENGGLPEFTTEDLPSPLDGFEDLMN